MQIVIKEEFHVEQCHKFTSNIFYYISKGSFTYDVHDLGGRGVWDFVTLYIKEIFLNLKFVTRGGQKILFFDGRHKWMTPNCKNYFNMEEENFSIPVSHKNSLELISRICR